MGHCTGQLGDITMIQERECHGLDEGDADASKERCMNKSRTYFGLMMEKTCWWTWYVGWGKESNFWFLGSIYWVADDTIYYEGNTKLPL